MRLLFTVLLAVMFIGSAQSKAAETVFFESLYDVPVMAGLTEVEKTSVSFDKVEGRIAYASALSENMSQNTILSFYDEVLIQLGWQKIAAMTYKREAEELEISFEKNQGKTTTSALVKFSLRPAN